MWDIGLIVRCIPAKRSEVEVCLHKGCSWACSRRDPDDTSNHVGGHRNTEAQECNAKTITERIQDVWLIWMHKYCVIDSCGCLGAK